MKDIEDLAGLGKLTHLNLYNNDISSITSVSSMTELVYLDLGCFGSDRSHIIDLAPVSYCSKLKTINLHWGRYKNIECLLDLPELKTVTLTHRYYADSHFSKELASRGISVKLM